MKSPKFFLVTSLMLLSFSALKTERAVLGDTPVLSVHRGMSANISCNYSLSNDPEIITVQLHKYNNELCSYINIKSWMNQSCYEHIRFIWIPETNEILFELSNLQINDSGTYICTVKRIVPPPEVVLWAKKTTVRVIASPIVSISCLKDLEGFPMIQCSSEGFYPSDLDVQMWLKDKELKNISQPHITTNPDGSITLHSYLYVSSAITDYVNYSCWVNHPSLNKPVVLHLSPADCYEGITKPDNHIISQSLSDNVKIALVISSLLALIIFIIAIELRCFRRTNHRTSVEVSVTPESVFNSYLQSEVIYSVLGDHRPVSY